MVSRIRQGFQLRELLQPTHRPIPEEAALLVCDTAIVASVSGPCGAVQVAVYGGEGAVLLPPLQVQHHPHLAPGEGGAGVLPAPALVQALALYKLRQLVFTW